MPKVTKQSIIDAQKETIVQLKKEREYAVKEMHEAKESLQGKFALERELHTIKKISDEIYSELQYQKGKSEAYENVLFGMKKQD